VAHLFRVASGLDSMILGEPQILGQVKQAYELSRTHGAVGPVLERLLQHCLATAKRVRTETGISRHPVSVAFAAVQLARKIFGELSGRKALLIGAGKMSGLVAKHLGRSGVADFLVASRSYDHALSMAEATGGRAVHWDDGLASLARVDIVVSCTDAPALVLERDHVARAMRQRRGQPLFLIDIAVPRDIDPRVNDLENAYLYDIDALQGVVETNLDERRRQADSAERLIAVEVDAFHRWRQGQNVTPMIVALRDRLHEMAHAEVERFRRKLGTLSPEQEQAVRELARAMVQKVLHRPIQHLRHSVERGDVASCAALYRELFGVEMPGADGAAPNGQDEADAAADPSAGPQRCIEGGRDG
jgi:glutamyl-tRNA reductase